MDIGRLAIVGVLAYHNLNGLHSSTCLLEDSFTSASELIPTDSELRKQLKLIIAGGRHFFLVGIVFNERFQTRY